MADKLFPPVLPQELVNKIFELREQKTMLDSDLAELYGVATKALNQAVKRNLERFPADFMFQLNHGEYESLRSQTVTSKIRGGRTYLPFAFTEHGILMLSSVLKSKRAVQMNIQIVRIFSKLRLLLGEHNELKGEIENIKKRLNNHDKNIEIVFS